MKANLKSKFRKGISTQYGDNVANKDKYSTASGANQKCFNQSILKNKKVMSFKDGDSVLIRFVPYEIDETHPLVKQGKMDNGDMAYMLGFDMHVIGEDSTTLACPHGSFGKKCPICEQARAAQDDGDDKTYSALRARRRVLYNIIVLKDYANKNTKVNMNEVCILHESQYLFEKGMIEELRKGGDDDEEGEGDEIGYDVADLCVGVSENPEDELALKVMCTGKQLNKSFSFKVVHHKDFWDDVDEDAVMDDALPLHKLLREFSYEELEQMILGVSTSSDEDDDDDDEEERRSMKRKSSAKKSSRRDDDDDDDDEDEDEDDEDERPARRSSKSKKASVKSDDDEDEDEDEEDERPSRKSRREKAVEDVNNDDDEDDGVTPFDMDEKEDDSSDDECPAGHVFGKDTNKFPDCETCDCYDECHMKKKELRRR